MTKELKKDLLTELWQMFLKVDEGKGNIYFWQVKDKVKEIKDKATRDFADNLKKSFRAKSSGGLFRIGKVIKIIDKELKP